MAWAVPEYSKREVNASGLLLIDPNANPDQLAHALNVINNWRSSHSFPLNTLQNDLRRRGSKIDPSAIVAQRIKRIPSIQLKLRRFESMKLSQMQDMGGCRIVVKSIRELSDLLVSYENSRMKHKHKSADYINHPKSSGYRGVHIVFDYYSDKNKTYNGLKIETQLRTRLQHAWATSVETVGIFLGQALKASTGEQDWLRFFELMGTASSLKEGTPPIPNTPSVKRALISELRDQAAKLDVIAKLRAYGTALNVPNNVAHKDSHFFLLEIDASAKQLSVTGFPAAKSELAAARYLEAEKQIGNQRGYEVVLVSVESLAQLRKAYPNYFLDMSMFIKFVEQTLA